MDEREREGLREQTGLGGEIGENVVVAEYDIASGDRRHGERRATERREGAEGEEARRMTIAGTAEGREVDVTGAVGMTRAEKVKVKGAAGVVMGDRTKLKGAAPVVMGRQDVRIERGGVGLAMAGRELELKDHGYAGVVVTPRVEVKEGGRVFVTAVAAVLGGLAIGVGWGVVALVGISMMRRRGLFGRMRARRMMRTGMVGEVTSASERLTGAVRKAAKTS